MKIEEALEIVITLARQASGVWTDWAEHERHLEAIATVEDMAVNQLGDD